MIQSTTPFEIPDRPPDVGELNGCVELSAALWEASHSSDGVAISVYRTGLPPATSRSTLEHARELSFELNTPFHLASETAVACPLLQYVGIALEEVTAPAIQFQKVSFSHAQTLEGRLSGLALPNGYTLPRLVPWEDEDGNFPAEEGLEVISKNGVLVAVRGIEAVHDIFEHVFGGWAFVPPNTMDALAERATEVLKQERFKTYGLMRRIDEIISFGTLGGLVISALQAECEQGIQPWEVDSRWQLAAGCLLHVLDQPDLEGAALDAKVGELRNHCQVVGVAALRARSS